MKQILIGNQLPASAISLGCMRMGSKLGEKGVDAIMDTALECGINFFDHSDIYDFGACESRFGDYLKRHPGVRDQILIQTKCSLSHNDDFYDCSKEHIISAVEGSLTRLGVDYVDCLLLHRPDTLMEPEEVAEAFDYLESSGKVRYFGVSNQNLMQMELLKTSVKQPLLVNQLQFSLTEAGMVTSGMNVNMNNAESVMRDGSFLEYARINHITVQAWSPYQFGFFQGNFIDHPDFPELNQKLEEVGEKYGITKYGVATAWILRHPANMQVIVGTMNPRHLADICAASDVTLTRSEWYALYLAAGHRLP